mmetsp:Transcript_77044/g.200714  ORF Transcript_77044/g.200714 Transcript_77044/m.200714 type:complete len:209 (-) Transcript_77044:579-1205(-)
MVLVGALGVPVGPRRKQHLDSVALGGVGCAVLVLVEPEHDLRKVLEHRCPGQALLGLWAYDAHVRVRVARLARVRQVAVPERVHQRLDVALGSEVEPRADAPVRALQGGGRARRVQAGKLGLARQPGMRGHLPRVWRNLRLLLVGDLAGEELLGGDEVAGGQLLGRRGHQAVRHVDQELTNQALADHAADPSAVELVGPVLAGHDDVI